MWLSVIIAFVVFYRDARAVPKTLAEEMAEITQLCCNQGVKYAKNHTTEECSSSIPPDVPSAYSSFCIFTMDECCKGHNQKLQDCDAAVDIASSTNRCDAVTPSGLRCCEECIRGTSAGGRGEAECEVTVTAGSAEDLLPANAFAKCCKKAAKEQKQKSNVPGPVTLSRSIDEVVASVCEDYAPNELCAHHCIPVPGSYKCECNPGYMLMPDGRNCIEVVKNRCKPRNPCQHKCNDNGVEVKCSCRRGYELMPDGKSCQDMDECLLNPPVCLPGDECVNVRGSYKCIPPKKNTTTDKGFCPPGFAKNIQNGACDDINECALPHPPCPSYLCENTIGAYKCGGVTGNPINLSSTMKTPVEDRCPPGFRTGFNEECEDVDECASRKHDCNLISQFCINTRGSFYCQDQASRHCPPGFKINARTNKCEDIDECEDSTDICRPDQVCVNQLGQYDCKSKFDKTRNGKCPDGMRIKPGTSVCEDIDECVEGTHLCDQHQNCLNTNGSHECHCKLGFELDITTGACVDVNECATDQHDCIPESQRCDNTVGSFLCVRFLSCGTGYILHHATGVCEDIDECSLGTHNCARAGPQYNCVNIPGSFRCVRKRASTTTTTAAPEYEYEYYDSEEEVNETNSAAPPKPDEVKPTSSTSVAPTPPPQTTPSTRPTEPAPTPELPAVLHTSEREPERPDERTNEIVPSQPQHQITSPNYREPESPEPERNNPAETIPQTRVEEPGIPETSTQSQKPSSEDESNNKEPDQSRTYEPYPPPPTVNEPSQNEPKTETNFQPTESEVKPTIVDVKVGEKTAVVDGTVTQDGSVIVDTGDVPKNEWTKINEKPVTCQYGFELNDFGACFDIDECATNRHSCSGLTEVCINTMGGYLCECAAGFRRDISTGACDVIPAPTTTSSTTTSTSPPTTTSTTTEPPKYFWGYPDYRPRVTRPFKPRYLCDVGYHHNSKSGKCEDINECINGQANCAAVEICVNTDGGYRCECPPNWRLDEIRQRCVQIRNTTMFPTGYANEREYPPPDPEETISHGSIGHQYVEPEIHQVEDRGSVIRCPWGYRLGDDNTCEDIDECVTGAAKCGPLQICTNSPGGYSCGCLKGYKLVGDHECADIDECRAAGSMPLCSQNADCINTMGSYKCKCHPGFRSAPVNEMICVDVDECEEARSGSLCQQQCNNVWGTYRCSCHRGYRLNADNRTCSDVDECVEFKSKMLCVGRCLNEPGSYRCSCPSGYRLAEDKRSCIDIDECETGEATCAKDGSYGGTSDVCQNTRGGYRCHRIMCPKGYQLESKNRCTRTEKRCPPNDWDCSHQPLTYSYNYITFVSNLYIPESKVDLFTMRGPSKLPNAHMKFQLKLVDVKAPPSVKEKADINYFLLVKQNAYQVAVSLVRPLIGPQSIELELSMELYSRDQFEGIAVAKLFIHVSEYEF
ncbi:fibrillin-1-like [Plodia interpunctella]|uniref:fibrillin-1-like n=1 Tax=Plodia interpunctella TaxID=58824 RepID=UPI002368DBFB|nr:fibrillin-1-like [Plodia interpunctella]